MAKGDDLEERLIDFASRIIAVCKALPNDYTGTHVGKQLLRSGTAPAAHYAEARNAESTKDFIHKLKIGVKELNETKVWLKISERSKLLTPAQLNNLIDECQQLNRIFVASIKTARTRTNT